MTREPTRLDMPGAGKLSDKSDEGVLAEWRYWHGRVMSASAREASLAAFNGRLRATQELRRRRLAVPES